MEKEKILKFIIDHWYYGLGAIVYDILASIIKTKKNISILDKAYTLLRFIIPNRAAQTTRIIKEGNPVQTTTKNHVLKMIAFFVMLSFSGNAQTNGNFKSVRFVNVTDSTTVFPINGTIYYLEQVNPAYSRPGPKFKIYENNAWYDLLGQGSVAFGSSGQVPFTNPTLNGFSYEAAYEYRSSNNTLFVENVLVGPSATISTHNLQVTGNTNNDNLFKVEENNGADIIEVNEVAGLTYYTSVTTGLMTLGVTGSTLEFNPAALAGISFNTNRRFTALGTDGWTVGSLGTSISGTPAGGGNEVVIGTENGYRFLFTDDATSGTFSCGSAGFIDFNISGLNASGAGAPNGQNLNLTSGNGYAISGSGTGGDLELFAGNGGAPAGNGGNVSIAGGNGVGAGTSGAVNIDGGNNGINAITADGTTSSTLTQTVSSTEILTSLLGTSRTSLNCQPADAQFYWSNSANTQNAQLQVSGSGFELTTTEHFNFSGSDADMIFSAALGAAGAYGFGADAAGGVFMSTDGDGTGTSSDINIFPSGDMDFIVQGGTGNINFSGSNEFNVSTANAEITTTGSGTISIVTTDPALDNYSGLEMISVGGTDHAAFLGTTAGAGVGVNIDMGVNSGVVHFILDDTRPTPLGLVYGADYSGTFTNESAISKRYNDNGHLSATGTIDFGNTAAQTSATSNITVTGAAVGDPVQVGTPAAPDANSCITAYVSAANTVTVKFNNYSAGAIDPASGSYKVSVFKY